MTPATLSPAAPARRRRPRGSACDEPARLFGDEPLPAAITELTLADRVAEAWEGLTAGAATSCVVCGSELRPRWSAGAGVVGGRCAGCGTTVE